MAMVNEQAGIKEEFTKRINKEKERVSQHKKQISELESNLMMEREQLQTCIQQNQTLNIKVEDLEQQIKSRESIQKISQLTQTLKKHYKDQSSQITRAEASKASKDIQTERVNANPFSMSFRI